MSANTVKLVPTAERKLQREVSVISQTYVAWEAQAKAMNEKLEKLDSINDSLLVIAGAIGNIGSFLKKWGPIAISILVLLYLTLGKIITQAAERVGVIQVEASQ